MSEGARDPHRELEEWIRLEEELIEQGVAVPLVHRSSWLRSVSRVTIRPAAFRDPSTGRLLAAFPVERSPARSLPGHYRLRITRFGSGRDTEGMAQVLDQVVAWTRSDPAVLSVGIEVFAVDSRHRDRIDGLLAERGFGLRPSRRRYRWTSRVRLDASEDEVFRSFSGTCRRAIRDPEKRGFRVGRLDDPRWARRMEELWNETFARTGTDAPRRSWPDHLRFAGRHPDLYRIQGTFSSSFPDEGSLVAFACARNNGDHGEFSDGASTRDAGPGVSLTYAPMWELIRWAGSLGCSWFDMGGVPRERRAGGDPLGGVSDFKRRFTEDVIEVGGEWELKPRTGRTAVADLARSMAAVLRRISGASR